jgi:hypothetical protein
MMVIVGLPAFSSPPNPIAYSVNSESHVLKDRFNHEHRYPWIFLNDKPFWEEFESCALPCFPLLNVPNPNLTPNIQKTLLSFSVIVSGDIHFEVIPYADWSLPLWPNEMMVEEERHSVDGIQWAGGNMWYCATFLLSSLPAPCVSSPNDASLLYSGATPCADLTLG